MDEKLNARLRINGGHFLINLTLFTTGALLTLIYMPREFMISDLKVFLALSAIIILADAVFSVSALGLAVLPLMSVIIGMTVSEEIIFLLETSGEKYAALTVLVSVPLHLCVSSYGFEYSLCLHRLQKQSGVPCAQLRARLYILITVALLASVSTLAAMILNR